jgi:hypothetical protein
MENTSRPADQRQNTEGETTMTKLEEYWAGSISQSVKDSVDRGDVVTIDLDAEPLDEIYRRNECPECNEEICICETEDEFERITETVQFLADLLRKNGHMVSFNEDHQIEIARNGKLSVIEVF